MNGRYRPKRRLRDEIFSVVLVSIVPLVLVGVFPFRALRPLPAQSARGEGVLCAFISLSPEEERAALLSARAAWQHDRAASRRVRADLFVDALPAFPTRAVGEFEMRPRTDRALLAPYEPDLSTHALAAPPPVRIERQGNAPSATKTFSRDELLKLN